MIELGFGRGHSAASTASANVFNVAQHLPNSAESMSGIINGISCSSCVKRGIDGGALDMFPMQFLIHLNV